MSPEQEQQILFGSFRLDLTSNTGSWGILPTGKTPKPGALPGCTQVQIAISCDLMINVVPLLTELRDKSILILGLGREGSTTFSFLRSLFPQKPLGLADQATLGQLSTSLQEAVRTDTHVQLHLGSDYLANLLDY